MKYLNTKLFIGLLFFYSIYFAQDKSGGIVQYESFPNTKKIENLVAEKKKTTKNKKLLTLINKANEYNEPIKSKLTFYEGKGAFLVEDKMMKDDNNFAQNMAVLRAGGSKEYYYNINDDIYLIKECEVLGECFVFDNKYLKWELTQETKKINEYIVYKATRSNGNVIAWYTPTIPFGFGPKGEYGLPGLILELEIEKIIFKATKITLNPKEEIVIKEPKGGKRLSYEEYSEIVGKAKKTVFGN